MRHTESCVIIVPEEHKSEVTRRISAIREKDEPKRLEYDCEKLKEELIDEFGVAATTASLVCGKKYGVVGYSPTATAIRNGKSVTPFGITSKRWPKTWSLSKETAGWLMPSTPLRMFGGEREP